MPKKGWLFFITTPSVKDYLKIPSEGREQRPRSEKLAGVVVSSVRRRRWVIWGSSSSSSSLSPPWA